MFWGKAKSFFLNAKGSLEKLLVGLCVVALLADSKKQDLRNAPPTPVASPNLTSIPSTATLSWKIECRTSAGACAHFKVFGEQTHPDGSAALNIPAQQVFVNIYWPAAAVRLQAQSSGTLDKRFLFAPGWKRLAEVGILSLKPSSLSNFVFEDETVLFREEKGVPLDGQRRCKILSTESPKEVQVPTLELLKADKVLVGFVLAEGVAQSARLAFAKRVQFRGTNLDLFPQPEEVDAGFGSFFLWNFQTSESFDKVEKLEMLAPADGSGQDIQKICINGDEISEQIF